MVTLAVTHNKIDFLKPGVNILTIQD